jgi:hypothetical protein
MKYSPLRSNVPISFGLGLRDDIEVMLEHDRSRMAGLKQKGINAPMLHQIV